MNTEYEQPSIFNQRCMQKQYKQHTWRFRDSMVEPGIFIEKLCGL